jgi:hypothetical protein
MSRGNVFIIHEVLRRNDKGEVVPAYDFRSAAEYGNLEVCLPHGRVALTPGPTIQCLSDKLRNFCDDDYLVAVGDPSAICIASAIAANNNRGKFKLLKWDKSTKQYIKVEVNLYNKN